MLPFVLSILSLPQTLTDHAVLIELERVELQEGEGDIITKHREQEQMEPKLNFQVPAEGLELVILLHALYQALRHHKSIINDDGHTKIKKNAFNKK